MSTPELPALTDTQERINEITEKYKQEVAPYLEWRVLLIQRAIDKGYSQTAIAQSLGISQPMVAKLLKRGTKNHTTKGQALTTINDLLSAHGYEPKDYDLNEIADAYKQRHGHYNDILGNPSVVWEYLDNHK